MAYEFCPWDASSKPILYAWEQHNPILDHAFEKAASYIIRKNGSYYEAIKGRTATNAGTIVYGGSANAGTTDGTDAGAVVNAAIAAASAAGGGKVFVNSGLYLLSTTLVMDDDVYLIGEGGDRYNNDTGSYFLKDANISMLTATSKIGFAIKNIGFIGNSGTKTGKGIVIVSCQNFMLKEVGIIGCDGYSLEISGTPACGNFILDDLQITEGNDHLMYFDNAGDAFMTNSVCGAAVGAHDVVRIDTGIMKFSNCKFGDSYHAISGSGLVVAIGCHFSDHEAVALDLGHDENQIIGCIFENNDNGTVDDLNAAYFNSAENIFVNNVVNDNKGTPSDCCVQTGAGSSNNIICQNQFLSFNNRAIEDVRTGDRIRDNVGFVTENSGTSTGTGAQQTIPHGLGSATGNNLTPNRVYLCDIESGANPYQSAAADATNIFITATINQDYVWKAEYKT